jgi:hypothetical protein
MQLSGHSMRRTNGVPIPRPSSQVPRPINISSEVSTPLSHSPSSSDSPFPFSPATSTNPASYISTNTNLTSPSTSISLHTDPTMSQGTPFRTLSYPSVPPPSLSSSFGSPTVIYHMPHRDHSHSPTEPLSRRNSTVRRGSIDRGARIAETGSLRNRRASFDRGARIAETGTLIARSRAGSQSLPSTIEVSDAAEMSEGERPQNEDEKR